MASSGPLPQHTALLAVALSCARAAGMLAGGRIHLPRRNVGRLIAFADGTSSRVYRETVVDRPPPADPCVLLVSFRLRGVRGRGHVLFEKESLLNTPLFVGFPGLVSKLWIAHDDHGTYRGLYQWDGPDSAEAYARALWRVLALVSAKGSIDYRVLPGLHRDELLAEPSQQSGHNESEAGPWWRVVDAA